ncbi:lipoprotein insertase outer membrane protein LolB [Aestuariirhabdus sp. Z084]|uniref:lipoprotein insertase outer membrane protein LolB n=1 Tax=Aestuariirhabdus haliotis TaxID=2918751 RepID=UPI00201B3AFB|nr:lipoprotein insertase outer membrane protein LolB [Aestuariirhabdus haliotis]MCL6415193.1 lipoprotein insertase outer membrane protein LolB [Aestuariirhabdus haliotis]MCL6420068.1 lipoprotein insertase outer membrane protein LolB [Aestuariirhabdus haliotis]
MRLIIPLILLVLTGCATLQPAKAPLSPQEQVQYWQIHQHQMASLQKWQLSGKLGIRTAERSDSLYLNWEQQGDYYRIRIATVIGQTLAIIQGSPRGISLSTADDGTQFAQSAEQLLRQELGWDLPVTDLGYWIRGIPAPGNNDPRLNNQGLLDSMQQGKWSLSFGRYQQVEQWQLPGRLVAKGPHARLTFIINDWKPSS